MTQAETEAYYAQLTAPEAVRFNALVETYLKLGKPIEGAYEAAHTIMTSPPDTGKTK